MRAPAADLVFLDGDIFTIAQPGKRAQALAIRGGRVVAVGPNTSVRKFVGSKTRVVQLNGRTVTPGLVDAHAHLYGLGKSLEQIELRGTKSAKAAAALVGEGSKGASADEWVEGRGWDQNLWTPKEFPHRSVLDAVRAEGPVALRRVDGHAVWVNSKALELAGIGDDTPDPAGGRIVRDEDGKATGVLVDAAMGLVLSKVPLPTKAAIRRRIAKAAQVAVSEGLTAVHEMGISDDVASVYQALADQDRLPLRVIGYLSGNPAVIDELGDRVATVDRDGTAKFVLRGVKVFADGALGSRGASLLDAYADDPGNRGLWVRSPEELKTVAHRVAEAGWQMATHAIGDAANRAVLDAYESVVAEGNSDVRFRVEHAQVLAEKDVARFAQLGVIASMQPTHATSDMGWAVDRLGKRRAGGAYAWQKVLKSGADLAFGSDFPVERVPPLLGLYAAVTRQAPDGNPQGGFFPDQRLSLEQAIRAFTKGAAYASFVEEFRGTLVPGAVADVTVFDRPLKADSTLLSAKVAMTIVGGTIVFERQ